MKQGSDFEPSVWDALRTQWWLVGAIVGVFLIAAFAYLQGQPVRYEATATVVVEDPRASAVFDTGEAARPERYVNNQASIIVSDAVAERAIEIAAEEGEQFTLGQIQRSLVISVFDQSDEIAMTFTANSEERAVIGVNAVASAYEAIRLASVRRAFDRAIEQLDMSIVELNQRLSEISSEIQSVATSSSARLLIEEQRQQALERLAEVQAALATASNEEREPLRASLDDIRQQLETYDLVVEIERDAPGLASLLQEQGELIDQRESLRERHDRLEIDASLESTGIVLFSPATTAQEAGSLALQTTVAALILGGLVATVIVYRRAVHNRRFVERSQPGQVLDAPLLTEIPDFRAEKVDDLPVKSHPASASAEAFRFVIPTINKATKVGVGEPGAESARSFVVVSAASGDGKSVVTANLGLAAALQQSRVLVVDADFGDQNVTRLLTGDAASAIGLTDLLSGGFSPPDVTRTLEIPGFPEFDLVSRGAAAITAPEFFGSEKARDFFEEIGGHYDVILIDAPPLLQVAYSSSLIQYSDRPLVVVPHGSLVARIEEVVSRLRVLNKPALGYIYTKAPLRYDLPRNAGSMVDILGTRSARQP